jgi:hypothetical protein
MPCILILQIGKSNIAMEPTSFSDTDKLDNKWGSLSPSCKNYIDCTSG